MMRFRWVLDEFTRYKAINEELPPWWYGAARWDWMTATTVYYPIPLNLVVMLGHRIAHVWNWWRGCPMDCVPSRDAAASFAAAWGRGRELGFREGTTATIETVLRLGRREEVG